MNPLVSIIIPAFNRADIIAETIESVIEQTYKNWECIIVDDGSSDYTVQLVADYGKKDYRIKILSRPSVRKKGANICRNIGLENATGDYIIFFDSDDIMTKNHVALKVTTLIENVCDFVITKTQYFNYDTEALEHNYQFDSKDITAYNYILQKINWLTLDVCIKKEFATAIRFNEDLKSSQEYNYFSKLVLLTVNALFLKEVVSLRRFHEGSIRGNLRDKKAVKFQQKFDAKWMTYFDIRTTANAEIRRDLIYNCINISYTNYNSLIDNKWLFFSNVFKECGIKGLIYSFIMFAKRIINKLFFKQKFSLKP
jgi:glycosyltransferase involved in cell wall biosynthesis